MAITGTSTSTLLLDRDDVAALLPMGDCIAAMEEAFRAIAAGNATFPLRSVSALPHGAGWLGVMPSCLASPAIAGVKVITVVPGNRDTPLEMHQGAVLLFEAEQGRLLAILDAGRVTTTRTAAASALATRLLARAKAGDLAILGSGTQAEAHLEAMAAVRPLRRIRVWSRHPERAAGLAARMGARFGPPVESVADARAAVDGADIICTVTSSPTPILLGDWIAPGAHVNAVGACTRAARELDTEAVRRSRLFVDRHESALAEAGDILIPIGEGAIAADPIVAELAQVVTGESPGRRDDREVTLFKSLGIAVEDLAASHAVYRAALASGRGTKQALGGARDA